MKECSEALKTFLHTATVFYKCDLYEITLTSGTVLRYADYDMPITLSDGRFFSCEGPIFSRGKTKLTAKIEVDSVDVSVYAEQAEQINGMSWQQAARNGLFDNANLTLYKCFMSSPGVVVGALEWFCGYVDVGGGGGLEQEWIIKSYMQLLNVDYPTGKYYPTCPYTLYSAKCGLVRANWTTTGTITQVLSKQEIYTNLTFTDGYYDLGGAEFTGGDLSGESMSIKNSHAANGHIVFIVALDSLPAVGDTIAIYPGCARTPAACESKFNNKTHNCSTPYIPLKETITK
ncbi:DUF2163 domain-containing protein [Anaeromusa sp.]|uniref:baseplate hub domain-containing protein n=1 Tax=Anaeromusa sp. TaxID=1872520 RepID=UPI00260A3AE7|nr:DUF2163 domain-containing protein [Anaeromusa sp.]MDD3157660.1 DUF2163 domain-containing protein [Anaeromusa sp.]